MRQCQCAEPQAADAVIAPPKEKNRKDKPKKAKKAKKAKTAKKGTKGKKQHGTSKLMSTEEEPSTTMDHLDRNSP